MQMRRRWLSWVILCGSLLAPPSAWAQPEVVRIGAEDDWAPFSSVQDGKPVGMAVELVKAIFAEAGIPLELVPLPYKRCMEEAKSGRLAGCFDTLPDAQLRRDYLFHATPLFSDPILILTRADNPAADLRLSSLAGKKVIVTHGYTYGDAFESNRTIQRVAANRDINALRMLDAKRADFAVVYRRITAALLRGEGKELRDKIKTVGQLTQADLFIAFSRQTPRIEDIIHRFEVAHAKLLKNQTISQIEQRWN